MIGNCLVVLCVAFGIAAGTCVQVPQCLRSSPVIVSSPLVQYAGDSLLRSNIFGAGIISGSGVITDGPETAPLPVIQAPSVTLPTVQTPVVTLPSQPIPAPRVISQRCVCTKTIVKPQVIQRQVTVPKIQRYLKRTVTPVVENISYKTRPVTSKCGCGSAVVSGNCYSRLC